jgi:hypothetical protein
VFCVGRINDSNNPFRRSTIQQDDILLPYPCLPRKTPSLFLSLPWLELATAVGQSCTTNLIIIRLEGLKIVK